MKFAFYGGQSGKGDDESIQIFTLVKRKCTQTETEICWTLIFQQRGPSYVTSPQDLNSGWFPSKSHNDILRYLLTSPFIPKLLTHVRGLTPMWGPTHLEKPRPLGAQPPSPWISDSHHLIIRWHALTLSCTYLSSSLMDTRVHLSVKHSDQLSCHPCNCPNGF